MAEIGFHSYIFTQQMDSFYFYAMTRDALMSVWSDETWKDRVEHTELMHFPCRRPTAAPPDNPGAATLILSPATESYKYHQL